MYMKHKWNLSLHENHTNMCTYSGLLWTIKNYLKAVQEWQNIYCAFDFSINIPFDF